MQHKNGFIVTEKQQERKAKIGRIERFVGVLEGGRVLAVFLFD